LLKEDYRYDEEFEDKITDVELTLIHDTGIEFSLICWPESEEDALKHPFIEEKIYP